MGPSNPCLTACCGAACCGAACCGRAAATPGVRLRPALWGSWPSACLVMDLVPVQQRPPPDTREVQPLPFPFEERGLLEGLTCSQSQGPRPARAPHQGPHTDPQERGCVPVGLGRQQWGSWGRPWKAGAGWYGPVSLAWSLCTLIQSGSPKVGLASTPRARLGGRGPVSWGQEGLGRLLASLSQGSTCLPVSHSSYSCSELTPAMLSRLRALRVPGDRLRKGHEPTSGMLSPGGWAASRAWS